MESEAADREGLFANYRHLCRRGARKFLRHGLERADLEQVAAIGLIKARDRYNERLGIPFAAYAWRMILSELGHHVRAHEHLVRPPRKLQALERRYWAEWERLCSTLEREPADAELAAAMETTRQIVGEIRRFRLRLQGRALTIRSSSTRRHPHGPLLLCSTPKNSSACVRDSRRSRRSNAGS